MQDKTMPQEALLDDKEAAAYLKLKPKYGFMTIRRWVKMGLLRGGKAGDRHLFMIKDLQDFVFSRGKSS